MSDIRLTPQQQRAVETIGRSLIVSAAAGSGKTSVLAQRCAYLVCDAPEEDRCNVDELLVLTFTDAAAAEMRERIVGAIRSRAESRPEDDRLRRQVELAGAAQISTIHAFCRWILRRWFSDAGLDPAATLLDADESALLKQETREALFAGLYASNKSDEHPLGVAGKNPADEHAGDDDSLATHFARLIDDYGLGDDRSVGHFVLDLAEFVNSLPDPEAWLTQAQESIADDPDGLIYSIAVELSGELRRQKEYCELVAGVIESGDEIGHFYADKIREYAAALGEWLEELGTLDDLTEVSDSERAAALDRFEVVCKKICEFQISGRGGPRLGKETEPELLAARDEAKSKFSTVKKTLLTERLRTRFSLFSVDELKDGLRRIAPYVTTLTRLVRAFREVYDGKKRELAVLDFSDLERHAFTILCSSGDPDHPSDIARSLQRKFAHVLVDEFQDINPIQQAIIGLVSREGDPDQTNNLFVVGDVKQSIYRFRLAEPGIFMRRLEAFGREHGGEAVHLQENFRSRSEVLDAVNLVFCQLMRRELGGIAYDEDAQLKPGRSDEPADGHHPVELHVLERRWENAEPDDEGTDRGPADPMDPSRWQPIEREAYLIGQRIRELMRDGATKADGENLRYRDFVVLLRAKRINAEKIATVFGSLDIPAYAEVGGSLLGAREVREVMAALQAMDNLQQDIPLAAVLRSGVMGSRLSEDDLVEIRCSDRGIPFHAVVRRYAEKGPDQDVRERLGAILDRVAQYRDQIRRRPVAQVLWRLYEETGHLAHAGGLPNGQQRRANLLKLHERARQFGTFRRQGLHRFLRFIESLEDNDRDLSVASAVGEAEDVVRIMSIHQSKGLEFPVVFVAGLGTQLNLRDRAGSMIYARDAKIGLRVVDPERMLEYPCAAHTLVAEEIARHTRAEELRVLYVAMTRAKERLILVGSSNRIEAIPMMDSRRPAGEVPVFRIATAQTPLDWLLPALSSDRDGRVRWPGDSSKAEAVFDVSLHSQEEMSSWRLEKPIDAHQLRLLAAAAKGEALPEGEPVGDEDGSDDGVLARIDYVYPQLAASSVRAVMGASEAKRALDYQSDPEFRDDAHAPGDSFVIPPSKYAAAPDSDAAHKGTITHRVLQHLNFARACDSAGLDAEIERMIGERLVTEQEKNLVDLGSIQWFIATPLARSIAAAGDRYRREFPYIALESPEFFDPTVGPLRGEAVLVRGIVDGILPVDGGLEIIDFKTDAVSGTRIAERAEHYRPQMTLYARAMGRMWKMPVVAGKLVFLSPREIVELADLSGDASPGCDG